MNDIDRIPKTRPILYELFCPVCGGSVYAKEEEPAYIGRPEAGLNPEGFTITKLECVLCRETFDMTGIGIKYEKHIAEELGWPFPSEIADGPSAIPERVEKRMRMRELDSGSLFQSIEDYYADNFNRSPLSLEKDVLHYVLKRKGKFAKEHSPVDTISVSDDDESFIAHIQSVGGKYGLVRKWLPNEIHAPDFSEGDIIESKTEESSGFFVKRYYVVYGNQFCPIAIAYK